jgi:pSer/pThr/pTyr-binding forkhead associated (FHA) protein
MSEGGTLTLPDGREAALRNKLTIGRDQRNHITLAAKSVSREHAVLLYADGRWWIEDRGSANGTYINDTRIPFGSPHPLRHADRVRIGTEQLVFSWPADLDDPDRTDSIDELTVTPSDEPQVHLSPFQLQVVRALCGAWVSGKTLDELPTNEQIAAHLGTPGAAETVKAALRRVYAKCGLSDVPAHAKRRALCRMARQRGWI